MTRYYTDLKPVESDLSRWTVAHVLRGHAARQPDAVFLIAPEEQREFSYAEMLDGAERVAGGMHAAGAADGDRVVDHGGELVAASCSPGSAAASAAWSRSRSTPPTRASSCATRSAGAGPVGGHRRRVRAAVRRAARRTAQPRAASGSSTPGSSGQALDAAARSGWSGRAVGARCSRRDRLALPESRSAARSRRSSSPRARPARPRAWRCRTRRCTSSPIESSRLTRLTERGHLPDGDAAVPRQRAVHGGLPGADRRRRLVVRSPVQRQPVDRPAAREHGVTVTNFVGVMMDFVWKQPPRADDADNALRCVFAAPTASLDRCAEFRERFGIEAFVEVFGLTETCAPILSPYGEHRPAGRGRPAGRATGSTSGWSTRRPTRRSPVGEVGELVVRPKHPWTLQPAATTACRRRPSRRGATCGSTPATRCAATRTAGTTSSTGTRTRCAGAARTSAPTRSSRRSWPTRRCIECAVIGVAGRRSRPARTR